MPGFGEICSVRRVLEWGHTRKVASHRHPAPHRRQHYSISRASKLRVVFQDGPLKILHHALLAVKRVDLLQLLRNRISQLPDASVLLPKSPELASQRVPALKEVKAVVRGRLRRQV